MIVKDPEELSAVTDILREHFADLKDIFKYYCTRAVTTSSTAFSIQWGPFTDFTTHCQIRDANVGLKDVDRVFVATNAARPPHERNPERALVCKRACASCPCFTLVHQTRFEFLESIVRLARAKYVDRTAVRYMEHRVTFVPAYSAWPEDVCRSQ